MLKDLEDDFYNNADDFIVEVIVLKDKDNPLKTIYPCCKNRDRHGGYQAIFH